jgi:hypothetical protein
MIALTLFCFSLTCGQHTDHTKHLVVSSMSTANNSDTTTGIATTAVTINLQHMLRVQAAAVVPARDARRMLRTSLMINPCGMTTISAIFGLAPANFVQLRWWFPQAIAKAAIAKVACRRRPMIMIMAIVVNLRFT